MDATDLSSSSSFTALMSCHVLAAPVDPPFASILCPPLFLYQIQTSMLTVCLDGIKPSFLWPSSARLAIETAVHGDVWETVLVHSGHMTKCVHRIQRLSYKY